MSEYGHKQQAINISNNSLDKTQNVTKIWMKQYLSSNWFIVHQVYDTYLFGASIIRGQSNK